MLGEMVAAAIVGYLGSSRNWEGTVGDHVFHALLSPLLCARRLFCAGRLAKIEIPNSSDEALANRIGGLAGCRDELRTTAHCRTKLGKAGRVWSVSPHRHPAIRPPAARALKRRVRTGAVRDSPVTQCNI